MSCLQSKAFSSAKIWWIRENDVLAIYEKRRILKVRLFRTVGFTVGHF